MPEQSENSKSHSPPMPDDMKKPKAFEAVQPSIPGVPAHTGEKPTSNKQPVATKPEKLQPAPSRQTVTNEPAKQATATHHPPYLWVGGGGAILVLVIVLVWWAHGVTRAAHVAPAATPPAPVVQTAPPQPVKTIPVAPGAIATTSEMKEPWSTKSFLYRNPDGEVSPALLVRLPGNDYWAFSLREPYGSCELEFASVQKLRSDYNLEAKHPMVGDPCTHTVYDLTRYGSGPNGLARGAVVAGIGLRPPLAIEVEVEGSEIVASRSE